MKISIQSEFGNAEINEQLELTGDTSFDVISKLQEVMNQTIGTSKIAFLFAELENIKGLKAEPDQELQEFFDSLDDENEELMIY